MTFVTAGPDRVDTGPFGPPHTLTGHFHILRQFRSLTLGNERDVAIYLPPGYDDDPGRRYSVLYMHDGQNLFDAATSFIPGQDWGLDETAEVLIREQRIEPIIMVGIDHAGPARARELTPTRDARHNDGGDGGRYARFLIDELKPYIDDRYRTRRDRAHTATGGASLGGLMSLYLGFAQPETFSKVMVMSPSLWWDRRSLLQGLRAALAPEPPLDLRLRIWLDVGTNEGAGTLMNTRMLKNALRRRGWTDGADLHYVEAAGANHSEAAWAARAGAALEFLFPPIPA